MADATAPAMPSAVAPVFVVGPPRSGTTLLRVTLNHHPEVHVVSETHLYDLWADRFPGLRRGDRRAFTDYWQAFCATDGFVWLGLPADDVPARLEAWGRWDLAAIMTALLEVARRAHGVRRVGEKTPDHARHVPELLADFPDARVLHLVRDPRATVASELRLDAAWTSDDPTVAAERWARGVAHATIADPRVQVVRYEDLVTAPDQTLRRVCDHVGVAFDGALLAGGGGHPDYVHGDRDPWARIDAGSLEAWRDHLSERELATIAPIVGPAATRLGYPSPGAGVGLTPPLASVSQRLRRRAARARRGRA